MDISNTDSTTLMMMMMVLTAKEGMVTTLNIRVGPGDALLPADLAYVIALTEAARMCRNQASYLTN